MTVCVSMLRGVNVGGHNRLKMDDLKELYESLGFGNVRTYIQSGNVTLDCPTKDVPRSAGKIEKAIEARFGLDVRVINRTRDELRGVVSRCPSRERTRTRYT